MSGSWGATCAALWTSACSAPPEAAPVALPKLAPPAQARVLNPDGTMAVEWIAYYQQITDRVTEYDTLVREAAETARQLKCCVSERLAGQDAKIDDLNTRVAGLRSDVDDARARIATIEAQLAESPEEGGGA